MAVWPVAVSGESVFHARRPFVLFAVWGVRFSAVEPVSPDFRDVQPDGVACAGCRNSPAGRRRAGGVVEKSAGGVEGVPDGFGFGQRVGGQKPFPDGGGQVPVEVFAVFAGWRRKSPLPDRPSRSACRSATDVRSGSDDPWHRGFRAATVPWRRRSRPTRTIRSTGKTYPGRDGRRGSRHPRRAAGRAGCDPCRAARRSAGWRRHVRAAVSTRRRVKSIRLPSSKSISQVYFSSGLRWPRPASGCRVPVP